jgi:hypothetical protein
VDLEDEVDIQLGSRLSASLCCALVADIVANVRLLEVLSGEGPFEVTM